MTFPEWLESREGQDALDEVMFGDRVQMHRALETAWRAGGRQNRQPLLNLEPSDDLGLSMADLPEGA